ncbi:type III-B CRISPR module RAMP protein Cmr4 [Paenibacillus albidus]|uniref:type III-B CRISPR module RAMP protein Cmr4 n=1 Tax=Paenibacillus albidus TaxID=2041023 RepID=UPI001BE811D1|nr:type III-B CRISPR module RAMP protein Cmr4 [Paenibacillus albidus]MBT2288283.1 type III-B CRISPR module RAMP protein Cmr4 [Paenibacillus albidus]
MANNSRMYYVHCMSPVHVGAGQGIGIIDMPMIREKVTEWPYLPGSSVKGVHREFFRSGIHKQSEKWLDIAFGKPSKKKDPKDEFNQEPDDGNAGALVMSDAKILAFPVASRYGTFAYVTCPLVLKRFARDTVATGVTMLPLDWAALEKVVESEAAIVYPNSKLENSQGGKRQVYIDEFNSDAAENESFTIWTDWLTGQVFGSDTLSATMLKERVLLVSDEAFQYFITMCSEIVPRIRIDQDTGSVESGALWNEEYLPAESLLYGVIWSDGIPAHAVEKRELLVELPDEAFLQIGGNATVGKGRIRCRYVKGDA